ncbi:MAG: hypothetical protein ABUK01_03175 [Leptospirales bacterium]
MFASVMMVANCANDGGSTGDSSNQTITNTVGSVNFNMIYVPGGLTTPTAEDDSTTATVANAYEVGETEVTYELWSAVYAWATAGAGGATGEGSYTFENPGHQGSILNGCARASVGTNQQPVTCMNWRDTFGFNGIFLYQVLFYKFFKMLRWFDFTCFHKFFPFIIRVVNSIDLQK